MEGRGVRGVSAEQGRPGARHRGETVRQQPPFLTPNSPPAGTSHPVTLQPPHPLSLWPQGRSSIKTNILKRSAVFYALATVFQGHRDGKPRSPQCSPVNSV
ncbi:hypothetical protein E2C01_094398 [Portunus trituberculatus]|uniref:Uncharacterized protein n=1 Tax=Portunus trituberculatus TaxID=210409 RepID=A0A5B7JXH1_PORTR|nr:hypothetical protein [Portunus trituberculatus]